MDITSVIHILIIPVKVTFGAMKRGIEHYTISDNRTGFIITNKQTLQLQYREPENFSYPSEHRLNHDNYPLAPKRGIFENDIDPRTKMKLSPMTSIICHMELLCSELKSIASGYAGYLLITRASCVCQKANFETFIRQASYFQKRLNG